MEMIATCTCAITGIHIYTYMCIVLEPGNGRLGSEKNTDAAKYIEMMVDETGPVLVLLLTISI